MVQGPDTDDAAATGDQTAMSDDGGWSRRSILRSSGAGVGLATALGITAAAGQEGDGDGGDDGNETNGNETNETQTDTGDSSAVFDDLVDPTWGYPLAADESDAADVEPVVELRTEEGQGAHSGFPANPQTGEELPFEFMFDPVGLHVQPGDLVKFTSIAGEHTATAFHEKFSNPQLQIPTRVPEDVPGFTSPPIVDGESWLYEFTTPGVYDILCLPHLSFGMVMRVVVADTEAEDGESETEDGDTETEDAESDMLEAAPTDGLPPGIRAVLDAEELAPSNIVEAGSVAWADLTLATSESTGTDGEGTSTPTEGEGTSTPTEGDGTSTPTDDSGGNQS